MGSTLSNKKNSEISNSINPSIISVSGLADTDTHDKQ